MKYLVLGGHSYDSGTDPCLSRGRAFPEPLFRDDGVTNSDAKRPPFRTGCIKGVAHAIDFLAVGILVLVNSLSGRAKGQGLEVMGSSDGSIFGQHYAAGLCNVNPVCPSRPGESWFQTLLDPGLIEGPTRASPEGKP